MAPMTRKGSAPIATASGSGVSGGDGDRLVAELRGNLPAILELEEELYNRGAGRGIWSLPNLGAVLEVA